MRNDNEWLQALKPGDRVVVSGRGETVAQVVRRTATQIIVRWGSLESEQRFRADTGWEVGNAGSWIRLHLAPLTPERYAAIKKARLAGDLCRIDWHKHDLATLERVMELLTPTNKEAQNNA